MGGGLGQAIDRCIIILLVLYIHPQSVLSCYCRQIFCQHLQLNRLLGDLYVGFPSQDSTQSLTVSLCTQVLLLFYTHTPKVAFANIKERSLSHLCLSLFSLSLSLHVHFPSPSLFQFWCYLACATLQSCCLKE